MPKPLAVTDETFDTEVLEEKLPVLVDFWADWCMPCKMVAPLIEELSEEFEGRVKFAKLDVDANQHVPVHYGIRSIPTLLVFKNGQPVEQVVGAVPKAVLKKRIDAVLTQ
jgi:thioredoxin 1